MAATAVTYEEMQRRMRWKGVQVPAYFARSLTYVEYFLPSGTSPEVRRAGIAKLKRLYPQASIKLYLVKDVPPEKLQEAWLQNNQHRPWEVHSGP